MDNIVVYIIAAGAALFIALPFFIGHRAKKDRAHEDVMESDTRAGRAKALENRKENLYAAIADMDFDYGLGKLSEEDYRELRDKYRMDAARVLKEIDSIGGKPEPHEEGSLEDEIMGRRKGGRSSGPADPETELENEIRRSRANATTGTCRECGSGVTADDVFCSKCGHKIKGD